MHIDTTAFIAEGVRLRGDVSIGEDSSIWYNTVIRTSDEKSIVIGDRTNVQDNCTIHTCSARGVVIGDDVTIGHQVIIHGCTIGDCSLIGMGSIVMNHAKIGSNCIIGAGSLVTEGTVIPDGSMAFGRPAKVVKQLSEAQIEGLPASADHYVQEARELMAENCRDRIMEANNER